MWYDFELVYGDCVLVVYGIQVVCFGVVVIDDDDFFVFCGDWWLFVFIEDVIFFLYLVGLWQKFYCLMDVFQFVVGNWQFVLSGCVIG